MILIASTLLFAGNEETSFEHSDNRYRLEWNNLSRRDVAVSSLFHFLVLI